LVGTWVPFERGKALAELYEVDADLAPILQFVKGNESPPLAPKHVTAASTKPRKSRETRTRKRPKHFDDDLSDIETSSQNSTPRLAEATAFKHEDAIGSSPLNNKRSRVTKATKDKSSKSYTKVERKSKHIDYEDDDGEADMEEDDDDEEEDDDDDNDDNDDDNDNDNDIQEDNISHNRVGTDMMEYEQNGRPYAQRLLQYFMSDKASISSLFTRPPRDLDLNVIIDDEGHTSLHWAAAMARIKIVKLIIENGADMYRVNYKGQTALMRSVLFTNNFDLRTFDSLLDLLRTTIFNIDKKDQTVFHHTAAMSDWKGKIYASRYYMECLINKLKNNQSELISILNVQDTNGDTALTIAAKIGNRRLIKMLIEAGASTEIVNEEGMTPKDYFGDIEKSLTARTLSPSAVPTSASSPSEADGSTIMNEADTRELLRARIDAMFKNVTSESSNTPPISEAFDDFAESYERDLATREKILDKKKIELDLYTKRLEETKRVVESINLGEDEAKINLIMQQVEDQVAALETKLRNWYQYSQKQHLLLLEEQQNKEDQEEKPPSPPHQHTLQELEASAVKLNEELNTLKQARKRHIEILIELHCRLPPKKYQEYKRLISTSCNVAYENVDLMLAPLLASFDNEQDDSNNQTSF
jgi:ankyrin repeat protein